eukprot:403345740
MQTNLSATSLNQKEGNPLPQKSQDIPDLKSSANPEIQMQKQNKEQNKKKLSKQQRKRHLMEMELKKKKNPKRKLRTFMNPESNFIREDPIKKPNKFKQNQDQTMLEQSDEALRHRSLLKSLRFQLEFYLGNSNLMKDNFLYEKLQKDPNLEISLFLTFNRVKKIFGDSYMSNESSEAQIKALQESLKFSKMLKLSKDGLKVKRRIPFKKNQVDVKAIDQCMIYVEKFPVKAMDIEKMTFIFKRAGKIINVQMPRYPKSGLPKGFAFVEYSSPEEAQHAVEMFNNKIVEELTNPNHPHYIFSDEPIEALKVISKKEWNLQKQEVQNIKRELAKLNPESMFIEKKADNEAFSQITKLDQLQRFRIYQSLQHFAEPLHADFNKATKESNVRFSTQVEAQAFINKVQNKTLLQNEGLSSQTGNIFLKEGRDKVQIVVLKGKDLDQYVAQAKKDQGEYHGYLKRVKQHKNLKRRQKKQQSKQIAKQQKQVKTDQ